VKLAKQLAEDQADQEYLKKKLTFLITHKTKQEFKHVLCKHSKKETVHPTKGETNEKITQIN